ncbi:MAG: iron-sulfur cluster repair di-iron protein [Bacteroidia bacterium]|nr:iron-sulfur cluster repair di-iron protein [Bacteroidia bacterium]
MDIDNLTLAEIVTIKPEAAPILEKFNLDFCCGGKAKLKEALKDEPQKLNDVTEQLQMVFLKESNTENNFEEYSLTKLIDYILDTHHSYVKENLPVMKQHIDKVASKHGERHPEMKQIKTLFDEIKGEFEQHMFKEEMLLFPEIKILEASSIKGSTTNSEISIGPPIDVMEFEHESAGNKMKEIKSLSNNFTPPTDACNTFRLCYEELRIFDEDLHKHVHLENNILFPKSLLLQKNLN